MTALLASLADWLEAIGLRAWASDNYPLVNTLHLLGLVMLVGGIGVVDLRLAGLWRAIPVEPLARALTPIALVGLGVMVASGVSLFAADGRALAQSDIFRTKLFLIAVALANAAAFRWLWRDRIASWDRDPPALGRAMAAASLPLWLAVGTYGRLIAYA